MSPRLRWGLLLTGLAAAAVLVLLDRDGPTSSNDIVADVPAKSRVGAPAAAAPRTASPVEDSTIMAIRPRSSAVRVGDSFAVHDWNPPVPPPAKPSPQVPTAPAVPFTVLGKKYEDGVWQVFLSRQDHLFVVKPRDTIENTYRVEDIRPPVLTLRYLPLNVTQSLPIGSAE